jgi:NAD+ kinase
MIGLVGSEPPAAELAASIDAGEVSVGDADQIAGTDPTVAVAVGDEAVSALVRAGIGSPVLPVETSAALEPVPRDQVPTMIEQGIASGFHTRRRPILRASRGDDVTPAVFAPMLVTAEPARISEYTVDGGGWTDRFRADGVVVSTPAGSDGYSRTLGGPVLDPDSGGLAVVPVAPFVRRSTVRVADEGASLAVTVERDEGGVSLLVDGRSVGRVPPGEPVAVSVDGSFETVIGED